jgi:hypothetical protein
MQYQLIIKDASGNTVVETDFMSRGSIDLIPTSDWQEAIEAFIGTTRFLNAMSPTQRNDFLSQFIGETDFKKAA